MLEQSPAARSKTPSDPPSEFSSWHDDASSSLATFCAGDRTITVNMQRMRMGEHLKGKLQGMIRQRFENYLHISQALQNDTGKLAALTCELRTSATEGETDSAAARLSISCNEDGTFLVYRMPDVPQAFGSYDASGAASSCGSQAHLDAVEDDDPRNEGNAPSSAAAASFAVGIVPCSLESEGDLLRKWVKQVCEFGMSGRCHSLTALFHFGYNTWKQLVSDGVITNLVHQDFWGVDADCTPTNVAHGRILEEEAFEKERPRDKELDFGPKPPDPLGAPEGPTTNGVLAADRRKDDASPEPRSLASLLHAAHIAAERERWQQALELCTEGITSLRPAKQTLARGGSVSSCSSSSAPARSGLARSSLVGEVEGALLELLSLRASVLSEMRNFEAVLVDAEELVMVEPTYAEGYYWQSVGLQGMGRGQEALEALMSALEFEPQNSLFQQAFTSLFEEISSVSGPARSRQRHGRNGSDPVVVALPAAPVAPSLPRRPRGTGPRDALSTTTQATHLSSRSTTPTEVSEPLSRSSSTDSLYVASGAFEDQT